MKITRLFIVILLCTASSNALPAGQGNKEEGEGTRTEHECDHTAAADKLIAL